MGVATGKVIDVYIVLRASTLYCPVSPTKVSQT